MMILFLWVTGQEVFGQIFSECREGQCLAVGSGVFLSE